MHFLSQNPTNEAILESFEAESFEDFERKLSKLQIRFRSWRLDIQERVQALKEVESHFERNREILAKSISLEMGKLYRESLSELDKSLAAIRFFRENAVRFLREVDIPTESKKSLVSFLPLGVIFGIMPWNFPVWQVIRFAVPALLSGNVVLLKPAPNVCQTTRLLSDCFSPLNNGFEWIRADETLCAKILQHPEIAAFSFTGSEKTGSHLASLAGAALKKSVLELGGSDAAIILSDADLDHALRSCLKSRFANAGQACIAAKRWIVTKDVSDEFLSKLEKKLKGLRMGDPFDGSSDFGPLARSDIRQNLHRQVLKLASMGYELRLGGKIPEDLGYFYPATLIIKSGAADQGFSEELFGPVVLFESVASESEAIQRANQTSFGLGASLYTKDEERALKLARDLQVGTVVINGIVRSDPRLPFGGTKKSGFGRELGEWGFKEFTNIQTVMVV